MGIQQLIVAMVMTHLLVAAYGIVVWFKERDSHMSIWYRHFGPVVLVLGGVVAFFIMEREKDPEFLCLKCWWRKTISSLEGVL